MKYRLVGNAICTGPKDWPPLLRDNAASRGTMMLVVNALNYYYEHTTQTRKPLAFRESNEEGPCTENI